MEVGLVGRGEVVATILAHCRDGSGVLLAGQAGVGKSRLLDEVVARLTPAPWSIERFVATEATRSIPFGPMISLMPPEGREDRGQLLASVRACLLDRSDDRRLVVTVDDAHLLDETSVALVEDLARSGDAIVLLTARTGEVVPPALTAMWASGTLERLDVGPLDPLETVVLTEAFLDGPAGERLREEVVSVSRGNPLFLRELLLDARAAASIERENGVWRLVRPLHSGRRLQELATARAGRLGPTEARMLEMIAVGEPLPVMFLGDDEGQDLDALERCLLARVEQAEGRWAARTDHPLIGEAIREAIPTRRKVEVLRDLAERVVGAGCPHYGDALRAARWWIAAGDDPPPEAALAAAIEALAALDVGLAAELAELSLADRVTCQPLVVLGNVRRLEGRPDDAEAALARAAELTITDEEIAQVATLRSFVQVHHYGQPALAVELLEQAAARVSDAAVAARLLAAASSFSGMLGNYGEVFRATRRILATDDLDRDTTWTTLVNMLYAQVMLGQLAGFERGVARALDPADIIDDVSPEVVDLLWALKAGAAVQRGDLINGEHDIGGHLERCRASSTMHGATAAIFLQLLVYRGSPLVFPTVEWTLLELDAFDPLGVRPIVLGSAALAHALAGRPEAAAAALDQGTENRGDPRVLPFVARGRAAMLAVNGDRVSAGELLAEAGRQAVATTHIAFGLTALHDAVLYGAAELVADDIVDAVADSDARLLRAMADHAVAARDGDGDALGAVGDAFAVMGAPHLAATAHAQSADAHERDSAAARRSAARSALWARAAAAFTAPEIRDVADVLSQRELDVAAPAAVGITSRAIADDLFVSVRTVDNHLRAVYRKLDVSGRSALAEVLAPLPGT